VGVAFLVGEGVVLPVHGDPLPPVLARADPQDAAEEEVGDRMKAERAVREGPMQIHRGGDHGGLGHGEGHNRSQQESQHV
jgi:hypothetical protein